MANKKPAKQLSGGARLTLSGKKAVNLGLLPEDYEAMSAMAKEERIPLTMFLIRAGLEAVKRKKQEKGLD